MTMKAELSTADPITRAAVAWQYGKVDIGGRSSICPVQRAAISLASGDMSGRTVRRINSDSFVTAVKVQLRSWADGR